MSELQPSWLRYPMGPNVREYLGISDSDYQGYNHQPSAEETRSFSAEVIEFIRENPPTNHEQFVNLLEELTNMKLTAVALFLAENFRDFAIEEDFRALLILGAAAMMENELDEAAELLRAAHQLEPAELAPLFNLAEIYFEQQDYVAAIQWATEGLKREPNHFRLLEIIARAYLVLDRNRAGDNMSMLSKSLDSYGAASLAAELMDPNDTALKAEYLAEFYARGERNATFLIEYTAALGLANRFEQIPPIVWEAEHIAKIAMPWQLYAHAAQAYFAMNQAEQAANIIEKAKTISDFPKNVIVELETEYANAQEARG